jgi:hypothetical protein
MSYSEGDYALILQQSFSIKFLDFTTARRRELVETGGASDCSRDQISLTSKPTGIIYYMPSTDPQPVRIDGLIQQTVSGCPLRCHLQSKNANMRLPNYVTQFDTNSATIGI